MSRTDRPTGLRRLAPWLGVAGLAALFVATRSLGARQLPAPALAALAGGLIAWVVVARADPPAPDVLSELDPLDPGPRPVPLVLAVAAAGFCAWTMPPEEFRLHGVLAWAAAIGFWYRAWWPRAGARTREAPPALPAGERWAAVAAFVLVMAAAAWFQFHDLAGVPANPVSDHAEEMLDMQDLLDGHHAVYFFRNLGNGPLHFYWTAFLVRVAGLPLNFLTLKIATAACGLLVAPALFLLGRELGGVWLGIGAAAFGAWSKWSAALARQGIEYVYPIPLTALLLWALLRYQRRGDRGSLLVAGLAIGLGLQTYLSFRIVPLLVPLLLGAALFERRRAGRRWRTVADGFLVAATSAILLLPVLKFAVAGPNRSFFWYRIATRATGAERPLDAPPLTVFAGNLWNMAKAFHWMGSSTWTVLVPGDPFLDAVSGALLLAGLVLAVRAVLGGAWRWAWLFPAFFLLTLPSTLSLAYPNENPSLNRASVVIPVVFLLVGLPFAHLWRGFLRERVVLRLAGAAALLTAASVSFRDNAESYFVQLGVSYDGIIEHATEMAAVMDRYRAQGIPLENQYLLATAFWVDARSVGFEAGDPTWVQTHNIPPPDVPEGLTARPLVFYYRPNDTERLEALQRLYPGGTARILPQSHPDRNFGVYLVRER